AVEGHETRTQLCNLVAEGGNELLLGSLAYVRRADGVHCPVIRLPVRDERPDADDRVVDVLREFVADGLADFHVGLADKIVSGFEPAEVGHSLQVPDDDAWFHEVSHSLIHPGMDKGHLSPVGSVVRWSSHPNFYNIAAHC